MKQKVIDVKNEQKTKRGFFALLKESFSKTGGCCCGPGEACGGPNEDSGKTQPKEARDSKKANQATQK